MRCYRYIVIIAYLIGIREIESSAITLQTKSNSETETNAVSDLIRRIIPQHAHKFHVDVNLITGPEGKDIFYIKKQQNGDIKIVGTSGVAAGSGFHYYLKYYCKCHISWDAHNLNLPEDLPDVNITITFNDRFRYYQNVCTTSYSFVWWDWKQWEKHIDWMVLNSYNFVLAFNGQEAIWQRVYEKLNLTSAEIDEHFGGPAFLSWSRMGNIRGWGGPLPQTWHTRSLHLQHQILRRMRELGIIPILPAFAGHVPRAFKRIYPNAKVSNTYPWNKFNDTFCCPYLLDPTDPLFQTVGNAFISELVKEFGTDHAYSCDTFNENQPPSGDVAYLRNMGESVYSAMVSADPKAVWVMQNWLFVHDLFWTQQRAEALLTSVPTGKMIVLDLQSEQHPQYVRLKSYYGQPYIWCMLHNFGGTLGMFGSVEIINKNIFEARNAINSTLVGTGITPEGINHNYVIYDLMSEMAWRKSPTNLTEWFSDYVERRYGQKEPNAVAAWEILKNTVYNYHGLLPMRGKYAVNRRPSSRIQTWIWYNVCDLLEAWNSFIQASKAFGESKTYLHDLTDITRQVLQVLGDEYYKQIVKAFKSKKSHDFQTSSGLFLELLEDMDLILKTNEDFLLGRWLASAKAIGTNSEEEKLYEYNARNQVTLWGPNGEITDYASKQWAGIVSHYFLPRWTLFLSNMNHSIISGAPFIESRVIKKIFQDVEEPFTYDTSVFPQNETGSTIDIALQIHEKWWKREHCRFSRSERYTSLFDLLYLHYTAENDPKVNIVT